MYAPGSRNDHDIAFFSIGHPAGPRRRAVRGPWGSTYLLVVSVSPCL
jgi:hypothetical protein